MSGLSWVGQLGFSLESKTSSEDVYVDYSQNKSCTKFTEVPHWVCSNCENSIRTSSKRNSRSCRTKTGVRLQSSNFTIAKFHSQGAPLETLMILKQYNNNWLKKTTKSCRTVKKSAFLLFNCSWTASDRTFWEDYTKFLFLKSLSPCRKGDQILSSEICLHVLRC